MKFTKPDCLMEAVSASLHCTAALFPVGSVFISQTDLSFLFRHLVPHCNYMNLVTTQSLSHMDICAVIYYNHYVF